MVLFLVGRYVRHLAERPVEGGVHQGVDGPHDQRDDGQAGGGRQTLAGDQRQPTGGAAAQRPERGCAQPVDGDAGHDDRGQRLPQQRVGRHVQHVGAPASLGRQRPL